MLLKSFLTVDDNLSNPMANSGAGDTDTEHQSELLLARAFVEEAHTFALLTAGAAGAVNFAREFNNSQSLIEADLLVSNYQSNLANRPHRVLAEEFSFETVQLMGELDTAFRRGREGLLAFEIDGNAIGLDRAVALHKAKLATIWRQAARIAHALISSLEDEATRIFSDEFSASAEQLITILSSVIDGNPECCQSNGKIVLPQPDERRQTSRHALLQSVRVRVGISTVDYRAFATDISSGGLGLSRMPPLATGTRVTIELSIGRIFNGTVAWSRGDKAGIAFDQPLSPTDPLIFG